MPRAPEQPKRTPFPVFATAMPVAAALALAAFTQSPFALVFALLGPVVAVASVADSMRRARKDSRRERNRFERDIVAAIHAIDAAHESERAGLELAAPSAVAIASFPHHHRERWGARTDRELTVRLGVGSVESGVRLAGVGTPDDQSPHAIAIANLFTRATTLQRAPATVDARRGVGVCGPRPQALALANSVLVQLAHALSPAHFTVACQPGEPTMPDWLRVLPHYRPQQPAMHGNRPTPRHGRVEFRTAAGGTAALVAVAADEASLPQECRIVVHIDGSAARVVRHPGGVPFARFTPEFVSSGLAKSFAETVATDAPQAQGQALPQEIALAELHHPATGGRRSLRATVGICASGEQIVDLVQDGPHAIVGGTTGSGKSELLTTWILAMAISHDPADVNFLLVDFKGGAAFSTVAGLPHTVGVLTDLDESAARRAILSLRAELGRRERILAEASAKSLDELDDGTNLARLVIVVDEFATLTAQLPELHELFADLAARGRSLGIHLILCTQRPGASVRDAVLANCSLRISLRVTNDADSIAVVGSAAAARLPRHHAGRALLALADGEPELVQFAIAAPRDVAAVDERWGERITALHRPWVDPLPAVLLPRDVPPAPAPALAFGVVDIPHEQRRAAAVFDPAEHGNLLVIGGHRSGKTGVLAALAHGAVDAMIIPTTIEGAWDAVAKALSTVRTEPRRRLVLFDDVDEVLGRFPADHESAFADRLGRLVREGQRAGLTVAMTATAVRGRLQAIAALCDSTLLLKMPTRQDHALAGGNGIDYEPDLPPGGGWWRGHRVQVALAGPLPRAAENPVDDVVMPRGTALAVVSSRPEAIRARLERVGPVTMLGARVHDPNAIEVAGEPLVVLGDPDAWQTSWGTLAALRSRARFVFHDCSVSDYRALTRSRDLPPPTDSPDALVVLDPDGRTFRATLPG